MDHLGVRDHRPSPYRSLGTRILYTLLSMRLIGWLGLPSKPRRHFVPSYFSVRDHCPFCEARLNEKDLSSREVPFCLFG